MLQRAFGEQNKLLFHCDSLYSFQDFRGRGRRYFSLFFCGSVSLARPLLLSASTQLRRRLRNRKKRPSVRPSHSSEQPRREGGRPNLFSWSVLSCEDCCGRAHQGRRRRRREGVQSGGGGLRRYLPSSVPSSLRRRLWVAEGHTPPPPKFQCCCYAPGMVTPTIVAVCLDGMGGKEWR